MVRCWNWNACHVDQTMNFMWKTEVLIENYQIWCMNAQVEFYIFKHEETCLIPKSIHFHEFWMMSRMKSMVGFVDVLECSMKKSLSLMRWSLSWVEKMVKWNEKLISWKKIYLSTWNFLVWNTNLLLNWVRSTFVEKLVCVLTPKLLFHSPKEIGTNEAHGVEIYTFMEAKGRPKVTQILIISL